MSTKIDIVVDGFLPQVGTLYFDARGGKQSCAFEYDKAWLGFPGRFDIDPMLPMGSGLLYAGKAAKAGGSVFFGCFADSEPDGWGKKVVLRDRIKRGLKEQPTALDYLLAMHDESRVGAIRFRDQQSGEFLATSLPGRRTTPALIEIDRLLKASAAVDANEETAADLQMLLGNGSPLGGMRPKCTVNDNGRLALAKFPSATDERDVVRGEVLALTLAEMAGITAASGRVVVSAAAKKAVAVIDRFDRETHTGKLRRLLYQSAHTFISATDREYAYTDIVDAIRAKGSQPNADIEELWRRIAFNILITNVDDHLHNHGFLHVQDGQWTLSPAFDLNPNPERHREFKTMFSHDLGADATIENLMTVSNDFGIALPRAREILAKVIDATDQWKTVATDRSIDMSSKEANLFGDAFEHSEKGAAREALRETYGTDFKS